MCGENKEEILKCEATENLLLQTTRADQDLIGINETFGHTELRVCVISNHIKWSTIIS